MYRVISTIVMGTAIAWYAPCACGNDPSAPVQTRISLTGLETSETSLVLQYEITNESAHDIWICDDMNRYGKWHFEALPAEDGHTLIVRKRLDVPADPVPLVGPYGLPVGRPVATYICLKSGTRRRESLSLKLPVPCQRILSYPQPTDGIKYMRCLSFEISFYGGDLREIVRGILSDAERISEDYQGEFIPLPNFGVVDTHSLWLLNHENKTLDSTTVELAVPYAFRTAVNPYLLRLRVEGVHIPFEETSNSSEIPKQGLYLKCIPQAPAQVKWRLVSQYAMLFDGSAVIW